MPNPRLHSAVVGALVIACATVACSSESTPTRVPPPTPELPAFEASGNNGGLIGDGASEFTGIAQWLNSEPLTMEGLQGKVVLIDFWTYT